VQSICSKHSRKDYGKKPRNSCIICWKLYAKALEKLIEEDKNVAISLEGAVVTSGLVTMYKVADGESGRYILDFVTGGKFVEENDYDEDS
jgi:hypothetical protein